MFERVWPTRGLLRQDSFLVLVLLVLFCFVVLVTSSCVRACVRACYRERYIYRYKYIYIVYIYTYMYRDTRTHTRHDTSTSGLVQ